MARRSVLAKTLWLGAAAAVLAALTYALAGSWAGDIVNWQLTLQAPTLVLEAGTNNGTTDPTGGTIVVTISPNGAEANVSANIVPGYNILEDVVRVNATGANGLNVWLMIEDTLASSLLNVIDPTQSEIRVYQIDTTGTVTELGSWTIDQLVNNPTLVASALPQNYELRFDLVLYVPDNGQGTIGQQYTLKMVIWYSFETNKPPV